MEPLATYHEKVLRGFAFQRREFLLFRDRLDVRLRWRSHATDLSLKLADFRPTAPLPGKTRLTIHKRANLGSLIGLLAIVIFLLIDNRLMVNYKNAAAMGAPLPPVPAMHQPLIALVVVATVLLGVCILAATYFRRPIDLMKFLNTDGKVALDILKSGPDARHFDEFVAKLRTQIRQAAP